MISVRVETWVGGPALEVGFDDGTGVVVLVFPERSEIPEFRLGTRLSVVGSVGERSGRCVVWNPWYRIEA